MDAGLFSVYRWWLNRLTKQKATGAVRTRALRTPGQCLTGLVVTSLEEICPQSRDSSVLPFQSHDWKGFQRKQNTFKGKKGRRLSNIDKPTIYFFRSYWKDELC